MRLRRVSVGLSIALMLGLVPTIAAAATTIRVDDDGKASATSCTGTASVPRSVQMAILAAGKNGTVIVCPGTYKGAVTITGKQDGITVRSAGGGKAKLVQSPNHAFNTDLVSIKGTADDVTIQGLTLAAATSDCQTRNALSTSGRSVVIADNRIVGRGSCFGLGILVDRDNAMVTPQPVSATIRGNTITDAATIAILIQRSTTTVTVKGNTIHYVHPELFPASATRRAHQATPAGIPYPSGVWVGLQATATVRGNTIGGAGDWATPESEPVLEYGVIVRDTANATVTGNSVTKARYGLYLLNTTDSTFSTNTLTDLDTGLAVLAVTDSTFTGNTTTIGRSGFLVQNGFVAPDSVPSTGNTFTDNVSTAHTDNDCVDASSGGTGTLGTKNTWTGNRSDGLDVPDGLCPVPLP